MKSSIGKKLPSIILDLETIKSWLLLLLSSCGVIVMIIDRFAVFCCCVVYSCHPWQVLLIHYITWWNISFFKIDNIIVIVSLRSFTITVYVYRTIHVRCWWSFTMWRGRLLHSQAPSASDTILHFQLFRR